MDPELLFEQQAAATAFKQLQPKVALNFVLKQLLPKFETSKCSLLLTFFKIARATKT